MTRSRMAAFLILFVLVAWPSTALAGRKALKIRVRGPKSKASQGEVVAVRVKVRNRTDGDRTVRLRLSFENSEAVAYEETLALGARERRRFEVPVRLPAEYEGKRLRLRARLEDDEEGDEDRTGVRMRPPEDGTATSTEWERGRDLFAGRCAACHDPSDRELRHEDLDDWLEAVREGEDDMPAFPDLSAGDVRSIREYVLDPGRSDAPSEDDAEWTLGRELYLASCSSCHGERGGEIRHEDLGDWLEAVREGEDDMPSFPSLTSADVRAMRKYVLDPDRVVTDVPAPPPPAPTEITYDGSVKAILSTRCTACHGPSSAQGGIRMDTYATAFTNRAVIVDSILKNRMPPGSSLGTDVKNTLEAWLDAGAPEK